MSPKTVAASSKETPWSLRFDAAFFGSHWRLYDTLPSYRRLSFRTLIGITTVSAAAAPGAGRTAVSVIAPVRFAVVRNMSGMVSTASRMPTPSTGKSEAALTARFQPRRLILSSVAVGCKPC